MFGVRCEYGIICGHHQVFQVGYAVRVLCHHPCPPKARADHVLEFWKAMATYQGGLHLENRDSGTSLELASNSVKVGW